MSTNFADKRLLSLRVDDLESFLELLQAYRAYLRDWDELGSEDREIAEGMRRDLLLGQAKVKPIVGDVRYVQMGFESSVWDGLGEPGYGHRGTQLTSLSLLEDAITSALGTAQVKFETANRARPTTIELTSLAYWASPVVQKARRALPDKIIGAGFTSVTLGVRGTIIVLAAIGGIVTTILLLVDRFG